MSQTSNPTRKLFSLLLAISVGLGMVFLLHALASAQQGLVTAVAVSENTRTSEMSAESAAAPAFARGSAPAGSSDPSQGAPVGSTTNFSQESDNPFGLDDAGGNNTASFTDLDAVVGESLGNIKYTENSDTVTITLEQA